MAKQNEIKGKFFLQKDKIYPSEKFSDEFLTRGINVYEVLRVVDSVPLFIEDHCDRFANSLRGKGVNFSCSHQQIRFQLRTLIEKNNFHFGNLKLVYHHEDPDNSFLIIYPVEHQYPSEDDYRHGVKTAFFLEERPDPEFKAWRPVFKQMVKQLKAEMNAWEIILINHEGIITEGSQSNLFFIHDKKIITAVRERILPGITRKYVYEICKTEGIEILEKDFTKDDIVEYESAFLSGTSPKILPVKEMDNNSFDPSHPYLSVIMQRYDDIIQKVVNTNKSNFVG